MKVLTGIITSLTMAAARVPAAEADPVAIDRLLLGLQERLRSLEAKADGLVRERCQALLKSPA
jgi:hypothetical protein